jgi:hypothetical protein
MFCWQQVGVDRLDPGGGSSAVGDPTLNVDPSRNGIEPDIGFTGANDKVAWVGWYETDSSSLGLRDNEQVFAAKIVADAAADGGFHWQAVARDEDRGASAAGHHHRGSLKIRWNLKVGGRLKPGKYLITLRALDRHRNVLGYANPAVVKISAS